MGLQGRSQLLVVVYKYHRGHTDGRGPNVYGFDSYVAIGDSFTEGLNDDLPDGTFRGWADRLAEILAEGRPDFQYANLALRGKMLDEILEEQLPIALAVKPDLVTLCAGGNDIIVPGADVDAVAARLEAGVAKLREAGIPVLIFNGPDTKYLSVMHVLRGKVGIYNAHLWAIADRHGAKMVDMWAMAPLHDRRAWSDDRLHFTPEAHRRIALRAAEVLGVPVADDWREPWPSVRGAAHLDHFAPLGPRVDEGAPAAVDPPSAQGRVHGRRPVPEAPRARAAAPAGADRDDGRHPAHHRSAGDPPPRELNHGST